MDTIDQDWLRGFDAAMKHFFAIDHNDAGMGEEQLSRYAELPPREAALAFGEKFDLDRADIYRALHKNVEGDWF